MKWIALFAATIVMLGAAASAVAAGGPPVFAAFPAGALPGTKQPPNSKGFGQVEPRTIFVGGASGVCNIHWISWGGTLALGTGIGLQLNPVTYRNYPVRVVIVLGDLGSWHGHRAYKKYTMGLPPNGHPATAHPHTGLKLCAVQKHISTH